jgi:hypothetical protein
MFIVLVQGRDFIAPAIKRANCHAGLDPASSILDRFPISRE